MLICNFDIAELHGFSQRLLLMRMEHIEERKGEEICDNNEVLAMLCIIATLQLFLGLNDRMEWLGSTSCSLFFYSTVPIHLIYQG